MSQRPRGINLEKSSEDRDGRDKFENLEKQKEQRDE